MYRAVLILLSGREKEFKPRLWWSLWNITDMKIWIWRNTAWKLPTVACYGYSKWITQKISAAAEKDYASNASALTSLCFYWNEQFPKWLVSINDFRITKQENINFWITSPQQGGHEFGKHEMYLHNFKHFMLVIDVKNCLRDHILLAPGTLLLYFVTVLIGG